MHHLPWARVKGTSVITDFESAMLTLKDCGCPLGQAKAWVDRPLAKEWAEDVIKPFIEAERKAGVLLRWRIGDRYLLFQDNLEPGRAEAARLRQLPLKGLGCG